MSISELSRKLQTFIDVGKGDEEIQVLNEGALLPISTIGTFANDQTSADQVVITVREE